VHQPWIVLVWLECREPHQPVESVVVRRYRAWSAISSARFAHELILAPFNIFACRRRRVCAFHNHFRALFCNAATILCVRLACSVQRTCQTPRRC
jgi:hypothetical protein